MVPSKYLLMLALSKPVFLSPIWKYKNNPIFWTFRLIFRVKVKLLMCFESWYLDASENRNIDLQIKTVHKYRKKLVCIYIWQEYKFIWITDILTFPYHMYIKQGIIDHNDIVHYKLNGTRPFKPMSFFYYYII